MKYLYCLMVGSIVPAAALFFSTLVYAQTGLGLAKGDTAVTPACLERREIIGNQDRVSKKAGTSFPE